MKSRLKAHLYYSWWTYLLVLFAAAFLWSAVFEVLAVPEDNEKLSIVSFGTDYDMVSLLNDLNINRGTISNQELIKIAIEAKGDDEDFGSLILNRMYVSDAFIFNEALLTAEEGETPTVEADGYFRSLPTDKLGEIIGDRIDSLEFFERNGKVYGIYLNDMSDGIENNFEKNCVGDARYIVVFSKDSVNLDRLYDKGEAGDGAMLDLVFYLLQAAN